MKLKNQEIARIIAGLEKVTGLKNFTKVITLGRDIRALRSKDEDRKESERLAKPANFDELLKEFQQLQSDKAKEYALKEGELYNVRLIAEHVLLEWPRAAEYRLASEEYDKALIEVANAEIDVDLHTTAFSIEDFKEVPTDMIVGESLSVFE